jgi:spore coat protein A
MRITSAGIGKGDHEQLSLWRTGVRVLHRFTPLAIAVFVALPGLGTPNVLAQQVPLAGSAIPQFVDPLPLLSVAGGPIETIIAGANQVSLSMCEFTANVMPSTFVPAAPAPAYTGTYVWGYRTGATCPTTAPTYIGPVFVATRGTGNTATEIKYINSLPNTATSLLPFWKISTDQTLHWADPKPLFTNDVNHCAHNIVAGQAPAPPCNQHYGFTSGALDNPGLPIPTVPHLHGGEVPPELDGGPDSWFTDGTRIGHAYYSFNNDLTSKNYAIYKYPNTQEAAPIWFHDHALGATRLNVYAGLAGAYVIQDPNLTLPLGLHPVGMQQQGNGGKLDYIVPLVIQDRMFDTNGQLFFPNLGLNPEHPFWIPEFVGDTIVVNGKVWPYLNVEARRYRFLLINGSNARTYELSLSGKPIWQIATDGGYLDAPVKMTKLTLMPGERADIIIDFAGLAGKQLILSNTGRTPFPKGAPPNGSTVGRIIQFRVGSSTLGQGVADTSYNPALGVALRPAMPRLVNPATGTVANNVTVAKTRLLTLNEVLGPLGPLEVLVNNTKWDGSPTNSGQCRSGFTAVVSPGTSPTPGVTECYSETPNEGSTEVWEIVNLTADAHPIHTHLTQVQLINRQNYNLSKYNKAYAAAFPGGVYTPGVGPPLSYVPASPATVYGGNPNVLPYLQGAVLPPEVNEAGWKDTIIMYPGQVTRIAVRYAPTDTLVENTPNTPGSYPFNPNGKVTGPGPHGYVWHCHIIDHEDNEMMRSLQVQPLPAQRTYTAY